MIPYRALAPCDWSAILRLIQTEFASLETRIDPPSSMIRLTETALASQAETGEIWLIGTPPLACMVLTLQENALYLGKLAVSTAHRGKGLARQLVTCAETRAQALGLAAITLQVRVELLENQALFQALGFAETGRSAHPGYIRPTSITYRKPVQAR